ncbi:cytosine deaminase [Bifidobacterium choloepi]|uniref:Cytosine deaminase n=1 Tax=Bifidobacterium choloepi TaxID=2614131 RepID=A0A6I5N6J3_9BIFI|nr:cytosine deaminase [Bifidobacterium choloepi]NEG69421.1 cytosine deaminase [Bifidobacterium choloepi]
MIIRNVHVENSPELLDVEVDGDVFGRIGAGIVPKDGEEVVDGRGGLLLPPFVDPHVHLDATLTAGEPEWNESGTLFDGIRIWSERKQSLTKQDVHDRAVATLKNMAAHGIQCVRTHVDVTDPTLTALHAMLEVREEVEPYVDLQVVAFPQEGILSYPNGKDLMRAAVAEGADVVGGIPHFEFTSDYGRESLQFLMDLAVENDRLVDVHCDEIDDPASRNLEVLATLALESGLKDRVTASHTTAFGSYNDAYAYKLMRLLKMADINFVSNPLVNMHLGGRFDTYPKRRGLTRVKELNENGVNVAFGEDDIRDPWSPLGTCNMVDVVRMGVYAAQLMGYSQLMDSYRFVTTNGARTMHLGDAYGIETGRPANCIILNAPNFYEVLNTNADLLYSIRRGQVLAKGEPATVDLDW